MPRDSYDPAGDVLGDISEMHHRRIAVAYNGCLDGSRTLHLQPDWGMDELLSAAGRRLDLGTCPTRAFTSDGMEVLDIMMLADDVMLFLSCGEDFESPLLAEDSSSVTGEKTSGLPAIVGGYKVMDALGKGGFGQVRLGVHGVTQERVALKFLPKSEISDMGAAERTTTEMQCLVALHHPNIIRLDAHIDTPAHVVLVFELMEGGDMFHYLCDLPGNKLPDEATAKAVFHQIVSGVGHAHNQHIAHRDLKLDNVLMGKDDLDCVKVADFGLSGFYQPGKIERTHCGSLNYIAPEVLQGTASAGPPLDVWGLGVILFAFLCGRLPFDGASSLSGDNGGEARARDRTEAAIRKRILAGSYRLDDWVSAEAKDLIRRMLRSDPDERASIPEIFSHCWLRTRNLSSLDLQPQTFFGLGGNSNHARPSSPLTSPRLSPLGIEEKQTSAAKKCLSATSPRLRLAPLDRSAEEKEDTGTCSLQQQSVKESCSPRPQPLSPSYHSEAKPIHYLDDFGSKDGAESSSHRLSRSAHMEPRSPGGTSMLPSIKSPRQAHCSSSPRLSSPQSDRTGPRFFPPQSPHSPTGQRSSYFVSDAADGKASGPPARLSEGSSDRDDDLPAVTPQRSWRGSNKGNGGGGRQLSPISAAETSTLSSTDSLSDSKDDQDVRSSPLSRQKRLIPGRGAKDLFPEVDADQREKRQAALRTADERRKEEAKRREKRDFEEREVTRQNIAAYKIQEAFRSHSLSSPEDPPQISPHPPSSVPHSIFRR